MATIVTVLLASGVIMGMLAISVDVGAIMSERRQLQNGADATSMALARSCAKSLAECASDSNAVTSLKPLANANAKDSRTTVASVCGHNVAALTPCGVGNISDLGNCPPSTLAAGVTYVETRTVTETASGASSLTTPFARALTGNPAGTTVRACARAAWGPAGNTGATLPLTMGYCQWANATKDAAGVPGKRYAPSPPYSTAPFDKNTDVPSEISAGNYPVAILAHDSAENTTNVCGVNANGQDYPGGFGWTAANEPCDASFNSTGTVGGDTGSLPSNCKDNADLARYVGTEVALPIAISASGTGSSSVFELEGIATFFLAGFVKVAAAQPDQSYAKYKEPSGLCTGKCNGSVTYIWGWFTTGILPAGTVIGSGPSRGATVVAPAG
ncbi:hypothetical protein GCM10027039_29280 [Terrabacter koreensis]